MIGTVLSTLHALSHLMHQQTFDGGCCSYNFSVNEETESLDSLVRGLFANHRNQLALAKVIKQFRGRFLSSSPVPQNSRWPGLEPRQEPNPRPNQATGEVQSGGPWCRHGHRAGGCSCHHWIVDIAATISSPPSLLLCVSSSETDPGGAAA